MRKGILWVGLVMVLVMGVSLVRADDNECNPGGVLYREENQDGCPTLWYWKAGWYLARFNLGLITRENFPKEFESVLPPLEKPVEPVAICWHNSHLSFLYIGPSNQKGNIRIYSKSVNCTGTEYPIPGGKSFVVFANNQADATALCAAQGTVGGVGQLNRIGFVNAPANVYLCELR